MSSVRLNRLMHSPLLAASLMTACAITLFPALRVYRQSLPVDIPGVNVRDLHAAIVICYRPGCGCEAHTITWTRDALQTRTPVFVLAQQWQPDMEYIRSTYGPNGAHVLYPLPASVVERYSPTGKTTISFLHDGRVAATATGDGALKNVLDQVKG